MNRKIGILVFAAAAVPLCLLPPFHVHRQTARPADPADTRDAVLAAVPAATAEPQTVHVSQTLISARLVHALAPSAPATRPVPGASSPRDAAAEPAVRLRPLARPAERAAEPLHSGLSRWLFGTGRYRPSPFPRPGDSDHR